MTEIDFGPQAPGEYVPPLDALEAIAREGAADFVRGQHITANPYSRSEVPSAWRSWRYGFCAMARPGLIGWETASTNGAVPAEDVPRVWLERASDLLDEPDPGPTPFLVDELLVEGSVAAVQGAPKTGKTWLILELAVAIVTGRPAFGRFEIPAAGPVILVLEESGRAALHRRLGALTRGNAIRSAELADLHFAANRRVRLDDLEWQKELLNAVEQLQPRAVFFDPLARLKAPGRNENAQDEMGVLLDFMRLLRDEAPRECSVVFVHHTGHDGMHLRGSSDLESYWESKIALKRSGDEYDFSSEHREAEAGETHRFRQAWDIETRSVRLRLLDDERLEELDEQVRGFMAEHPEASGNAVADALDGRRQDILAAVRRVRPKVVPAIWEPPGTTPSGQPAGWFPPGGGVRSTPPTGTTREQVVPSTPEPPDLGTSSLDDLQEHFGEEEA